MSIELLEKPSSEGADLIVSPSTNQINIQVKQEIRETKELSIKAKFFNLKTLGSFAFSIVLVIFFIFTVKIDLGAMVANLAKAEWGLLLVAFVIYYATFYVRGLRWEVLLKGAKFEQTENVKLPSTVGLSRIVFLSWFVNCILPARLGDAYRSYLLKQQTRASMSRGLGTVVAERVVDLITLMILLCVSGFIAFSSGIGGSVLQDFAWVFAVGIAVAGLLMGGLLTMRWWVAKIIRFVPSHFQAAVVTFQAGIAGSIQKQTWFKLYALTGLIWLAEAARLYFVMVSLHLNTLNFAIVLFVALLGSLLSIVPFTPSGLGAVEGGLVLVLTAFSVEKGLASAVVLLDRIISYWSNIGVGAVFYFENQFANRKKISLKTP